MENNSFFLHTVEPGPADKSYGLQVAKLAGLPKNVIQTASKMLKSFEKSSQTTPVETAPLEHEHVASTYEFDALISHLKALDPNDLSPKEALAALFEIKSLSLLAENKP